jgi:hypothetical protein
MGRKPITKYRGDQPAILSVRMSGHLRNDIVAYVAGLDSTINAWAAAILKEAMEAGRGLPPAPPAPQPLPTKEQIIHAYLTEEPLLEPCGKDYPCDRHAGTDRLGAMEFCKACRIRVV